LLFARRSNQGDIVTKTENSLRRYTSISAVIDILQREQLPLLDPQNWDDRNDRYFMGLYKEKKKLGALYGLCAAQCAETYHHWKVFTGTADGACIEIKRDLFEESLGVIPGVRFDEVEYLTLPQAERLTGGDVDRLPFLKRAGFKAEEEYRVIAETTDEQKPALSIDFPHDMISCIYLNPWLPETIAESLIETLKLLGKIKVSRSLLINSSRWKRAGDQVVSKVSPKKTVLKPR
jgi:hypothetical protein